MSNMFAIIEIGSNNTKTHIYKGEEAIYENTTTIEFKNNYKSENKINEEDLNTYNTLPTKSGIYKVYCLTYDVDNNQMEINYYTFEFNA